MQDPAALIEKLPALELWIDSLLASHAREARSVASLPFQQLANYYEPETLRAARVIVVDEVPPPPLTSMGLPQFAAFEHMDANGITYRDTFFVDRRLAHDESLHFHELVH